MLGDYAVGKTSLLNRFLGGGFQPEYIPTIKTSISEREFRFPNYLFRLVVWDMGGERTFNKVRRDYCSNAQAAIIVYDVCRPASFESVEEWYRGMDKSVAHKPVVVWLVGNKVDLNENRLVDEEEAKKKAEKLGFGYMETSAKSGENVEALFTSILRDLIKVRLDEVRRDLRAERG